MRQQTLHLMIMSRVLIAILVLALAYYPTLYALTWQAKDDVIAKLITAAEKQDRDTLQAYVDWDRLKQFLKRDLGSKAESVRNAQSVPSFGPPPDKIDELVDHYITPKGIQMALAIKKMRYPDTAPRAFIAESGIEGPSSFSVTLALPEKIEGKKGPRLSKGQRRLANQFMRVRFVFVRKGWRWRTTQMHVPIFLVPPEAISPAQIERKLKQAGP